MRKEEREACSLSLLLFFSFFLLLLLSHRYTRDKRADTCGLGVAHAAYPALSRFPFFAQEQEAANVLLLPISVLFFSNVRWRDPCWQLRGA